MWWREELVVGGRRVERESLWLQRPVIVWQQLTTCVRADGAHWPVGARWAGAAPAGQRGRSGQRGCVDVGSPWHRSLKASGCPGGPRYPARSGEAWSRKYSRWHPEGRRREGVTYIDRIITNMVSKHKTNYNWELYWCNYFEVVGVVGVRHQAVLVGALQLEAMGYPAIGRAVLAVAVEFGQAVTVTKLSEVLVGAVHSASTQVLHYAWTEEGKVREAKRSCFELSISSITCTVEPCGFIWFVKWEIIFNMLTPQGSRFRKVLVFPKT